MPKLKEKTKPKGISKVHINPKTKKKEYKCSYRFMGLDGKVHQSDTPWCETPEEAFKAKAAAIRLHEEELKTREKKKEANKRIPVFPESLSAESAFNHDRMFFGDFIRRFLFRNIQFQYTILILRSDVCFGDILADIETSLHHS